MRQVKIHYVRWVVPPYRAMTIPPLGIFIKKKYRGDKKILNHDMVHWQQYQKMGLFKFYFRYFKQFLIYGYDNMPMELEARYEEDEYIKKHYSETYHKPKNNP